MSILNFQSFVREKQAIKESNSLRSGDAYLVGDSCSILLASTKQLKNTVDFLPSLSVIGIGTKKFRELLEDYKTVHPETKFLFLSMGGNDLYHVKSSISKDAYVVKEELDRIFPNAQKFIFSAGGWGWGNLDEYGDSKTPPVEMLKYYQEIWEPLGFIFIPEYVGITFGEGGNPTHPNLESPGIKELADKILQISTGKEEFYKEEIKSLRELGSISQEDESVLKGFYDVLQNAVHEGISLKRTNSMIFNPVVERCQIALRFFEYTLPKFGVDGIFGPETENSVREYKNDYKVEGNASEMDSYFFISLINNLKEDEFSTSDIIEVLEESYRSIESIESEENAGIYGTPQFGSSLGDDEYLIFVQHNQGVAGATSLVKAKYGKGEIYPSTKESGMISNIPSDMKEWRTQILQALNSGDDQRAASLFLEMWKQKYASKKQRGMELINKPEYAEVKGILEKVSVQSGVPFDVLVAIATIESGLNPKVGNRTFKGLFALNPSTAKKYNSLLTQSTVHDPVINADAASKMIATKKNEFINSLNRAGVLSNLSLS